MHANTLYGRLARVQELLGDDWTDPDRIFEIDLALRLHALMGAGGRTGPRGRCRRSGLSRGPAGSSEMTKPQVS